MASSTTLDAKLETALGELQGIREYYLAAADDGGSAGKERAPCGDDKHNNNNTVEFDDAAGGAAAAQGGGGSGPPLNAILSLHTQGEEYLRFLLGEKERKILDLTSAVARLSAQVAGAGGGGGGRGQASGNGSRRRPERGSRPPPPDAEEALRRQLSEALADGAFYKDAYERVRADYRALSIKKIHEFSSSAAVNRQAKELIAALGARLARESEEREHVKAAFNAKLYKAEQESCDWFVEKKLLLLALSRQEESMQEHKVLGERIDDTVVSIYSRMRKARFALRY